MSLTENQLEMEINKGNVIRFLDGQEKKHFFGWVISDTSFTDVLFNVQVVDEFGDPILIDGITWEGIVNLDQVQEVIAESLDQFKNNTVVESIDPEGLENRMIYGLQMNLHQVDQNTIQMYILGDKTRPVTVEHPDKHPNALKPGGKPYARHHESLFNILKTQLTKEGKWS